MVAIFPFISLLIAQPDHSVEAPPITIKTGHFVGFTVCTGSNSLARSSLVGTTFSSQIFRDSERLRLALSLSQLPERANPTLEVKVIIGRATGPAEIVDAILTTGQMRLVPKGRRQVKFNVIYRSALTARM